MDVKTIIIEIKAEGLNENVDITKAVRIGYIDESSAGAGDYKLGRVEVEVSSPEVKAKIMETNRVLFGHQQGKP